jgi:hypothetical protein
MIWELQWKVELVDMPEFFSNSMDVAKIMQLYLQKEITETIFLWKTFDDFNTCYFVQKATEG